MKITDVNFDFSNTDPFRWHKSQVIGRLVNSMSIYFPVGEKFFIKAVRRYEDRCSGQLQEDIRAFYKQEANHSREHQKLNRRIEEHGLDIKMLEKAALQALESVGHTPERALMVTVVLEVVTSLLAHALIKFDRQILDGSDSEVAQLLRYHAREEIDHEHVASSVLKLVPISFRTKIEVTLQTLYILAIQTIINYRSLKRFESMFYSPEVRTVQSANQV